MEAALKERILKEEMVSGIIKATGLHSDDVTVMTSL